MKAINEAFPKRTKLMLAKLDINQREAARRIGITEVALSHLLHGKSNPRPQTVERAAKVFGVTVEYLLGAGADKDGI
jgi:transcriptional regulator with XRE-family HTH domain